VSCWGIQSVYFIIALLSLRTGAVASTQHIEKRQATCYVRIKRTISRRGQVRDFWSGTPDLNVDTGKGPQHNFFVGGGVIWRFGKS